MAFKENSKIQLRIDDPFFGLTKREKKYLKNSWADNFYKNVFSSINERRFEVLYSSNPATRPNTPVNVTIAALILKELFRLTDEELMERMLFDVLFQHALGTTSFEEQPISDRTLSRFRERLYNYELTSGRDLLAEEMKSLSERFIRFTGSSKSIRRMDSVMVSSSCKKMSRLELIYTTTMKMAKLLDKKDNNLPEFLRHYLDEDDANVKLYHRRSEEVDAGLEEVLKEALYLVDNVPDPLYESLEYRLLRRVLNEQTREGPGGRVLKANKEISPSSVQNPSDPDASFRIKAGKSHKGYVANFVETCGDDGPSFITDYDLKANTYSDLNFSKDLLEGLGLQEEELTLIADGAYGSEEVKDLARANKINLITTSLVAKSPDKIRAHFELCPSSKEILLCPGGYRPIKTSYYEESGLYRGVFDKEICMACSYKSNCGMKEQKKTSYVMISEKTVSRAKDLIQMGEEAYKELARKRNGIEGIPSILRRRYGIDNLPVRGLLRSKAWLAFKVGAINVKRLLRSMEEGLEMA